MSPIRRKTAEHMVLSKRTSAHVSTVFEIDMTRIDQLRQKHKATFEERGRPAHLHAVHPQGGGGRAQGLPGAERQHRRRQRRLPQGRQPRRWRWPSTGASSCRSSTTPTRRTCSASPAPSNDLADRARAKKLKVEEVQGGTFTVTNPGVFGSLFGTPIINQPQVAILGIGTIEKRPVVRDDAIAIRTMCYFALTFDHRLVDGADADRFMAHVKTGLQEFDEAALM